MNFCTVVLQKFMSTLITKAEFARRVGVGRSCVGAWVSTGKLDVITSFAAPLIVLYKGFRSWHGRPAELSPRSATWPRSAIAPA